MSTPIYLTGIKPTGEPHLGNYLGAIKPAIELVKNHASSINYFFIADYHALTTIKDPKVMKNYRYHVAATWLSFFENLDNCCFYFQSDVPQIFELYWILSCFCPKGLLNRAHAYKSIVGKNIEANHDPDKNINHGLFSYPVLMAADILLFEATHIPIGADQKQHVEIAIEIVKGLNRFLSVKIPLPKPIIQENAELIIGIDGQKMSKNYNNTLPIFADEKDLKKRIGKISTSSIPMGQPLDDKSCNVFKLSSYLMSINELSNLKSKYQSGAIGYGHAKAELLATFQSYFHNQKQRFESFLSDPITLEHQLSKSSNALKEKATQRLASIKKDLGFL
ncbi:MAG: tryptophan--tRNA ligase [Candidatus Marinamargulisbacteria bacterium]